MSSNEPSEDDDDTLSDHAPDFGVYAIWCALPKCGQCGSYLCDLNSDSFNLQWPSVLEFEAWLDSESKKLSIDLWIWKGYSGDRGLE
jgi:hypothetical protein